MSAHPDAPRNVLITGDIHTLTDDPRRFPDRVEALGVRDGAVVSWGTRTRVQAEIGPRVPELALPGTVLPGFVDSHVHVAWAGRRAGRCDLSGVTSVAEIVDRLSAFVRSGRAGDEGWIEADAGFETIDLAERRLPDRHDLDRACPGRCVLLDRKGHDVIVSSPVLRIAGVDPSTPDPPGGRIERDPDGIPTGLLIEHPAADLARVHRPEPDLATQVRRIEAGQAELLGHGITTAMDPAVAVAELPAWAHAARTGRLAQRAVVMPWGGDEVSPEQITRALQDSGVDAAAPAWLRAGPTKLFLDGGGSLGTAWRSTPWPGTGGDHGNRSITLATLREHCAAGLGGRGVGVHAVGDAAIDAVLDVLDGLPHTGELPYRGTGFHLIHGYLSPTPGALARAARLGVALSAHPALQWEFGTALVERLGVDEAARANPLRDWLAAGVVVGGGSDGPGAPLAPLFGMWQARTRMVRGLAQPLGPQQAIDAQQALAMFTTGAAAITGHAGRLRAGGPGDLVALDVDPSTCSAEDLAGASVLATVVAGDLVAPATP